MRKTKLAVGIALTTVLSLGQSAAFAAFITGVADPDYTTSFQGASASTFATTYGFTVGTGATDLKVSTGTFADPVGFTLGTLHTANSAGVGFTSGKLDYAYGGYGGSAADAANSRDYAWIQNAGTNATTSPALDTPWAGTIWDLGGQANQAVVFPIVDHGPLPQEAVEYTVYLTNKPTSTLLSDWSLALLDQVYLQGWESDTTALADGFTTVWKLAGGATFQYVSVQGIGSQAFHDLYGNEDEIDAVGGLTAAGGAVGTVPEPVSILLMGAGLIGLGFSRRRRT